ELVIEKPVYIEREIAALPEGPPTFIPESVNVKLTAPPIADPTVERLVEEARDYRVGGDSMRALMKLEEAEKQASDEPNILYQFAEVYEAMGLYDKAADYYQQVFGLGTVGAGSLYELAAVKLTNGISQPEDMAGRFALGRIRLFADTQWTEGQRVILTIPVSAATGLQFTEEELQRALEIKVHLYDDDNGNPKMRDEVTSSVDTQWVTPPVDWQDGGEELLRVIYEIPFQGTGEQHLLGGRRYLGQVVELFYQGELIDRLASPRRLAREFGNARGEEIYFYPENYVPDDFNFDNPLLPPLPE
ncbi:MAG: hypothetical protein AAGC74_03870, partial [Verrucomicrobiota bacterium]